MTALTLEATAIAAEKPVDAALDRYDRMPYRQHQAAAAGAPVGHSVVAAWCCPRSRSVRG